MPKATSRGAKRGARGHFSLGSRVQKIPSDSKLVITLFVTNVALHYQYIASQLHYRQIKGHIAICTMVSCQPLYSLMPGMLIVLLFPSFTQVYNLQLHAQLVIWYSETFLIQHNSFWQESCIELMKLSDYQGS